MGLASRQADTVIPLCDGDRKAVLQKPKERFGVRGAESTANTKGRQRWVIDDDLAAAIAIELGNRFGQRRLVKHEVTGPPTQELFHLSRLRLIDENRIPLGARLRSSCNLSRSQSGRRILTIDPHPTIGDQHAYSGTIAAH